MKKRGGQLQISFGMIFSIILIIAFIATAFYAIKVFLGLKKCAETGLFMNELQEEIDRAFSSDDTSSKFEASLPLSIEKVCFADLSKGEKGEYKKYFKELGRYGKKNMFFMPLKNACSGQEAFKIKHLDLEKITKENNPYCVKNVNGKIQLKIEKGYYDKAVKIS